ncbi:MAG: VCBS repeat-containing protein, partial [Bacteroidales bacterium]|nr:VCBS repeat-containing protein [Bacteroidales bacterium]
MRSITISALLSFLPIFLFCQSIDWEQRIQDANGSPFFTGGFSFANPCFADIDKDGDADCFVGKQDGTISYFENTGSVTSPHWQFITAQYNDIAFSYMKYGNVTFTDIDDDGDLDMFYGGGRSSNNSGIHFYRNDGNAFQPDWVLVSDQYMNINTNPTAVYNYCKSTFADLDNDGDQDLLFGNYNKDIYYENTGNAQSANFVLADLDYFNFGPLGYWNYHNPALTDIDQDGDFDCFIGTTNSHFLFFENTGTPENAQWNLVSEEYVPIECCENIAPAFYDIDDDSDKDMFVGLTSGKIRFYLDQSRNASPVWEFQNDNPLTLDIGFNSN